MVDYPALSGIDDPDQVRVALVVNKQIVHVPLSAMGLQPAGSYQPLDADLTSWALITRASGFDTFAATPSSANLAALVTDESGSDKLLFGTPWVTYTPTFTGFGTVTSPSVWSRRIGDTLHLRGKFTCGTSTAVESRMTLGFNGTNANVNSDATKVPAIMIAGYGSRNTIGTTIFDWRVLIESNVGYVTFGHQTSTASAMNKQNGNAWLASGETFWFSAEVPISGW